MSAQIFVTVQIKIKIDSSVDTISAFVFLLLHSFFVANRFLSIEAKLGVVAKTFAAFPIM